MARRRNKWHTALRLVDGKWQYAAGTKHATELSPPCHSGMAMAFDETGLPGTCRAVRATLSRGVSPPTNAMQVRCINRDSPYFELRLPSGAELDPASGWLDRIMQLEAKAGRYVHSPGAGRARYWITLAPLD